MSLRVHLTFLTMFKWNYFTKSNFTILKNQINFNPNKEGDFYPFQHIFIFNLFYKDC